MTPTTVFVATLRPTGDNRKKPPVYHAVKTCQHILHACPGGVGVLEFDAVEAQRRSFRPCRKCVGIWQ